ncbi:MAG: chromate transporter [Spirochaetia bacterium]|nr:chromate transporter [Spirochaetia bacterium]
MSMLMLFFVFFYVGLFAIGGGLVAASFMRQALVEQYGLITDEKFYSMLAISESTPGPIGINIATYIGTELHGSPGGIIATFGEVLPSIIIIIIIARFFSKFQEKPLVKSIFSAMRPCTSGMVMSVFASVFSMAVLQWDLFRVNYDFSLLVNLKALAVYVVSLAVLFKTKLHPVFIILFGAAAGIIFF